MILSYFHDPRCRTSHAARPRCAPRRISSVDSSLPTLCSLCFFAAISVSSVPSCSMSFPHPCLSVCIRGWPCFSLHRFLISCFPYKSVLFLHPCSIRVPSVAKPSSSLQPLDRNIPEHHRIIMPRKTEMPAHAIFARMRTSCRVSGAAWVGEIHRREKEKRLPMVGGLCILLRVHPSEINSVKNRENSLRWQRMSLLPNPARPPMRAKI